MIATARVQPAEARSIFVGKAKDREAGRWQRLKVVQFLDMAIADVAAGLVSLPDQRRVMRPA